MQLSDAAIHDFVQLVWGYYRQHGRVMPWRENPEPYWVLVSELMLQQTQVGRVMPKFAAFIHEFPTMQTLASAPLDTVLRAWSGLGYNRRAKFLHQAARQVVQNSAGIVPATMPELMLLPGIGKNTAGAVLAYAYNQPVLFIETNIRSVYFHHFLAQESDIDDQQVLGLLGQTLDRDRPREWYWALMDYGTHLKQTAGNNISRSRHYTKQSTFVGSRRQLRGRIIKLLLDDALTLPALTAQIMDERLDAVVKELQHEGFIALEGDMLKIDTPI